MSSVRYVPNSTGVVLDHGRGIQGQVSHFSRTTCITSREMTVEQVPEGFTLPSSLQWPSLA